MIRNCARHVGGKLEALAILQIESLPSCENIEDDQEEDLDYSYKFCTPSLLIQSHTVPEISKTLPLTLTTSESSTKENQHERRPITISPRPQRLLQGLGLRRPANSAYSDPSLFDINKMVDYDASPSRSPGDMVKYLIFSGSGDITTKEKFSRVGCYETLQDLVSLVLKRNGT